MTSGARRAHCSGPCAAATAGAAASRNSSNWMVKMPHLQWHATHCRLFRTHNTGRARLSDHAGIRQLLRWMRRSGERPARAGPACVPPHPPPPTHLSLLLPSAAITVSNCLPLQSKETCRHKQWCTSLVSKHVHRSLQFPRQASGGSEAPVPRHTQNIQTCQLPHTLCCPTCRFPVFIWTLPVALCLELALLAALEHCGATLRQHIPHLHLPALLSVAACIACRCSQQ